MLYLKHKNLEMLGSLAFKEVLHGASSQFYLSSHLKP